MSSRVLARIAAKAHAAQQNPNDEANPQSAGTSQGGQRKRPPSDNIVDPNDQHPNKRTQNEQQISRTVQTQQPPLIRPILSAPENKDKEVIVKIEAGARWTSGLQHPMQALSVFDLPADAVNYENHQTVELINRARRRFGRFAAEFVHLSNLFEKFDQEESRQKLLEETLALRNERRQLGARVEELNKANKNFEALKKAWEGEKTELVNSQQELTRTRENLNTSINELKTEVTQLKKNLLGKEQELEQAKNECAAAELDAENALKDGYVICYKKIQAAGVDVAGMSYEDYLSELADQLAQTTLHKESTSTAQAGEGGAEQQQKKNEEQTGDEQEKTGNAP